MDTTITWWELRKKEPYSTLVQLYANGTTDVPWIDWQTLRITIQDTNCTPTPLSTVAAITVSKWRRRNRTGLVSRFPLTAVQDLPVHDDHMAVRGLASMVIIRATMEELYDKHAKREHDSWKLWVQYLDRLPASKSTATALVEYGNCVYWTSASTCSQDM